MRFPTTDSTHSGYGDGGCGCVEVEGMYPITFFLLVVCIAESFGDTHDFFFHLDHGGVGPGAG